MKNSKFYYDGYNLTFENSLSLQKAAELAAKEEIYGVACSLNILAAEESIKCCFILLKYLYPQKEIQYFKEVFRNHIIKHTHIKSFLNIYDIHINNLKNIIEPIEQLEMQLQGLDKEFPGNRFAENIASSIRIKDNFKAYLDRQVNMKEISEWIENANTDKNNGFYVGLINENKWLSPKKFSKEKYTYESKLTNEVINFTIEFEKIINKKFT